MSDRYGSRTLVSVIPFQGVSIHYGFATSMSSGDQGLLGHEAVDLGNPKVGLVLGANAPKPGRARKKKATGYESSFYDYAKSSELTAAGWKVSPAIISRGKGSRTLSYEVYITLGGIKYAWNMPATTYHKLEAAGGLSQLGIKLTESTDIDYVKGARYPRPPRAQTALVGGETTSIISTFYDPSKTLPDGFEPSGREYYNKVD